MHSLQTRTAAETALAEQFAAAQGALPAADRARGGFPRLLGQRPADASRRGLALYRPALAVRRRRAARAGAPTPRRSPRREAALTARAGVGDIRPSAIVDGRYIAELSDAPPDRRHGGVRWRRPARVGGVDANVDALLALNGALAQGGCVISVEAGAESPRASRSFIA